MSLAFTSSSTRLWTPVLNRSVLRAPRSHTLLSLETVIRQNIVKLDKPVFEKLKPTSSFSLLSSKNHLSQSTLFGSSTNLWRPITVREQLVKPRFYCTSTETKVLQKPVPTIPLRIEQRGSVSVYKLAIPLPKWQENCVFTLRGNQTVADLAKDVISEDPTVESVTVYTDDGRVSKSTVMEEIFSKKFTLIVQGDVFHVIPPENALGPGQSYSSLAQGNFEQLKNEFLPLYLKKKELDRRADRLATVGAWAGFGFLAAQWCFLARLTWWEFNWDIMEPVTYFITFGTAVLGYLYFAITKREYSFLDARDAFKKGRMFKSYMSKKFPVDKYFLLEYQMKQIEPEALEIIEEELQKKKVAAAN